MIVARSVSVIGRDLGPGGLAIRFTRSGRAHALALSGAVALAACSRAPEDLREWTPADHRHTSKPNAGQVDLSDAGPTQAAPNATSGPVDDVVFVAWRKSCVRCHGTLGRGDGPEGPMVKATDLSRSEWQTARTDEQIAMAIARGKGSMPAFDLPPRTVTGLVALVRLLGGVRRGGPSEQADGTADGGGPKTP